MGLFTQDESTRGIGRRGERAASKVMKRRGYPTIARNVRFQHGEIDLVCEDRRTNTVIVVEVKARLLRRENDPRRPEDNITDAKKRKLRSLTTALLEHPQFAGRSVRIDVVSVLFRQGKRSAVETTVFENAV